MYDSLRILDISRLSSPTVVGSIALPRAVGVYVAGGNAYVTESLYYQEPCYCGGGLHVVDVHDPAHPHEAGFSNALRVGDRAAMPRVSAVVGNLAYAAITGGRGGDGGGLAILDVSDPAHIKTVGTLILDFDPAILVVEGGHAYLAAEGRTPEVVDASNPSAPARIAFFLVPRTLVGATVFGHLLYVPDEDAGLEIYDVGDPARPVALGAHPTVKGRLAVSNGYGYAVDASGLHVMGLADPVHPVDVRAYHTSGSTVAVAVQGNTAYVAANAVWNGL